jgi:hypothetical protein
MHYTYVFCNMITMFNTASNKNIRSYGISVSCYVKFQLYKEPLFYVFKFCFSCTEILQM